MRAFGRSLKGGDKIGGKQRQTASRCVRRLLSFCTSGALCRQALRVQLAAIRGFLLGWDELDLCAGAVAVDEDLVGDAANVGFGDGVDLVELAEKLSPIAVTSSGIRRVDGRDLRYCRGRAAGRRGRGS